jgi:hypothetical protein
VGDGLGPGLGCDVDENLRDQGPGQRGHQWVAPLVQRVHLQRREYEGVDEVLAGIDEPRIDRTESSGTVDRFVEVAGLSDIDGHGDHVVTLLVQPRDRGGGVEAPRVRQHYFLHPRTS